MDTTQTCPNCGKPLAPTAPAGLCPECLMQAAFPTGTEPMAEGKKFSFRPPSIDELKPHFPQLEILSFIGQGGMGAVYKARQPMLDRYVALKILPPEASSSPGFTERFTREARALARLNHPNIVAVHEFGRSRRGDEADNAGGYHYLLMEFVDGVNLREMQRTQKLSPTEALSIVPKICEALQYAHDEGVVHRDIKPENILVDKKGRVKIADFGIAKILGAEQTNAPVTGIVGTPHYMAPEQVEKPQTVDHRADIYSVGVVFYEMLTGELPLGRFAAPSKKVQIDVRLDEVVLRALEKEPELRYQQAGQVKTAVETISTSPAAQASTQVVDAFNAEKTAVAVAQAWLELADARKYGETWDIAAGTLQAATTRAEWTQRMERYRHALNNVVSRHLAHTKTKPMGFGLSPGSQVIVYFNTRFTEMASASETVTLTLTSAGQWKVTGYIIKPSFAPTFIFDPKIRKMLWFVASVLFLNVLWPHHIGYDDYKTQIKTFGGTQPWVSWVTKEQPDGSIQRTVSFNRRSTSAYSGFTAAALLLILFATRNKRVSQQGPAASGTSSRSPALRIPLVTVQNGDPKINWSAVCFTGVLIAALMAGAMCAAASFTLSDKSVSWVLKTMVLPVVVLIPLWLFLLVREEHQALRQRETSPISPRKVTALRRVVGSVLIAVIIAAFLRVVIEPFHAMNDAVAPEINAGSTVVVYKLGHNYRPGDIIIYRFHATGYPTKYLLGRVTALPQDGQVAIERRHEPPLKIAISDVVGKVIFNTRVPSPRVKASAEIWAPVFVPTNGVEVSKVLDDAKKLAEAGEYEKALLHHIWYHNHALDTDTGQTGVRLSFALSDWVKLGEKFPKALRALTEIRDDAAEKLLAGQGDFKTFMDLHSLNSYLKNDEDTYKVFKTIEQRDPKLAKRCYIIAENLLVDKGDYQTCKELMGDPQEKFARIKQNYQMQMESANRSAALRARIDREVSRLSTNSPKIVLPPALNIPNPSASLTRFAQERFVAEVCRLVEVLIATGSTVQAEDILHQANQVMQSPRFDSAIADAKIRIAKHITDSIR